jgi:hypothetical protein
VTAPNAPIPALCKYCRHQSEHPRGWAWAVWCGYWREPRLGTSTCSNWRAVDSEQYAKLRADYETGPSTEEDCP